MKITNRQKKLIDSLDSDQNKVDKIYRPGPYWSYKCKKANNWIIKNGFNDFRGLNSPVGTSFSDNLILDKRNEFGLSFKSKLSKAITQFPIFNRLYQNQVNLTKTHIESYLTYQDHLYQNSERVKYLLNNYKIKESTLFDSIRNFNYENEIYSCLYLENLDKIDEINKKIELEKIRSVFEIGGGFGSNIHLLLQNFKNIKKVIYLDVSPNIFIGTEYLRHFYKDAVVDYLDTKNKEIIFSDNDELEIFCVAPWQLPNIKSKIDYFHNANSFQEMTRDIIKNYSVYINNLIHDKSAMSLVCYMNDNPKIVQIEEIIEIFKLQFDKLKLPEFFRKIAKSSGNSVTPNGLDGDYILLINQKKN